MGMNDWEKAKAKRIVNIGMSDWEKAKAKRIANIGFISRSNAFREPTEAERAAAVAREIDSWQHTFGKKPYSLTSEYSIPKGHGINLKQDTQFDIARKNSFRLDAIEAYIETPMNVPFEKPPSIFNDARFSDWWFLIGFPVALGIILMIAEIIFFKKGN